MNKIFAAFICMLVPMSVWAKPVPVVNELSLTWDEARTYCKKLDKRLPNLQELSDALADSRISIKPGTFWSSETDSEIAYIRAANDDMFYEAPRDSQQQIICVGGQVDSEAVAAVATKPVKKSHAMPDILQKAARLLLHNEWPDGTRISTKELGQLNRLNLVTTLGLITSLTAANCGGVYAVELPIWEGFSKEEQDIFNLMIKMGTPLICKKLKLQPAGSPPLMPLKYRKVLENLVAQKSREVSATDLYFTYSFLAIDDIIKGHYKSAALELRKMKECETLPHVMGDLPEASVRELLDTMDSLIEDRGIYYRPVSNSYFQDLKFKAKVYVGNWVQMDVTVTELGAETDHNYVAGFLGEMGLQEASGDKWDDSGKRLPRSLLEREEGKRNGNRVIIEIPAEESSLLPGLSRGSVIHVKGQANGLRTWNSYFGDVPLVKADKVIAKSLIKSTGGSLGELKFNAKAKAGTSLEVTVTVIQVIAGMDHNYVAALQGRFSAQNDRVNEYMNWTSELSRAEEADDSERVIIEVMPAQSDILSRLGRGSVITVRGKARGLYRWNPSFDNVPLIRADDIVIR